MPYITFSRNFSSTTLVQKALKANPIKDSVVERRGTKTIKRIAELAQENGFDKVLIVKDYSEGKISALQMRVTKTCKGLNWKFGKTESISVKK